MRKLGRERGTIWERGGNERRKKVEKRSLKKKKKEERGNWRGANDVG